MLLTWVSARLSAAVGFCRLPEAQASPSVFGFSQWGGFSLPQQSLRDTSPTPPTKDEQFLYHSNGDVGVRKTFRLAISSLPFAHNYSVAVSVFPAAMQDPLLRRPEAQESLLCESAVFAIVGVTSWESTEADNAGLQSRPNVHPANSQSATCCSLMSFGRQPRQHS